MVQAAHARQRDDLRLRVGPLIGSPSHRAILLQRKMTAILVIVANVVTKHAAEMALTQNDDVVQEILPC